MAESNKKDPPPKKTGQPIITESGLRKKSNSFEQNNSKKNQL